MGDLRGVNIMSLELALQRELAFRRKVDMLLPPDSDFVSQLGSMEVQSLNAGSNTTLNPSPSSNSGSSARLSGKRQVPTTNSLEPLLCVLENRVDQFFCKICQVPCSGSISYKQHIKGEKHKTNLRDQKLGKQDHDKQFEVGNQRPVCELCKIWCMNEDALKAHLEGQKHKNVLLVVKAELAKNRGKETIKEWWCELYSIQCIDEPSLKMQFSGKKHQAELQKL